MKVNYFFPVFEEDNVKEFLKNFFKTDTFLQNKDFKMVFVCNKEDKKNHDFLVKEAKKNKDYKVLVFNKNFSYNEAFYYATNYFDGDVVLLGDLKLAKIDLVFAKCLEKHKKGANIVHVFKKKKGLGGFFKNLFGSIYNFFIKLFTGKEDRLNIISLGLIDKNLLQLFRELPRKSCFLKNTNDFYGFESKSIFIDAQTKTYDVKYKQKTASLILFYTFLVLFFVFIATLITINSFVSKVALPVNILLSFLGVSFLVTANIFLPKHFFERRNEINLKTNFDIKEIN